MLIKDNDLANTMIGQQVVFGLVQPHEMWITGQDVNNEESAYAVVGCVDNLCKFHGIVKPWSKLVMEFMQLSDDEKIINRDILNCSECLKLAIIGNHQYICGKFNDLICIYGASCILFVSYEDKFLYSGTGDKKAVNELINILKELK